MKLFFAFLFLVLLGLAVLLYLVSTMTTPHSWLHDVHQASAGGGSDARYVHFILKDGARNSGDSGDSRYASSHYKGESQTDAKSVPGPGNAESHATASSFPDETKPPKASVTNVRSKGRTRGELHRDVPKNTREEKIKSGVTNSSSSSSASASTTSDELVRAASAIAEKRGMVLFSVLNDAYVDLVNSWLCNTASLGDVHSRVLFLSTDRATGRRLRDAWPNVTVVSAEGSRFSGPQSYTHAGYVRLMVERTRLIQRLVQSKVRLLLFEVDFVWLDDPLPVILAQSRESGADIVATKVHRRQQACGCFLLLNPTAATGRLWTRLTQKMNELDRRVSRLGERSRVSQLTNDQAFLSDLIKERYGGVNVSFLPEALFPDGKWYTVAKVRAMEAPYPLLIHNNWIVGNAAKIQRAKQFRHWFLSANSTSGHVVCDVVAVRDLVSSRRRAAERTTTTTKKKKTRTT